MDRVEYRALKKKLKKRLNYAKLEYRESLKKIKMEIRRN